MRVNITISQRCEKAYIYLKKHKVNAATYLKTGGEMAVINKANEFYQKEKRIKNAPNWFYN